MSQLALLGGAPVLAEPLVWTGFWPPVDDATETALISLYRSRKWTAFDDAEHRFAGAFAAHHGASAGVFMANGTVTLQCALGAYGIGEGDEVIVPALTWYATAMAAHYVGATPVLVDIDPQTLCIDPERVREAITDRTKAIVPVHLYGSMADMDELMTIARRHGLRVIEDCAHMHGGVWAGRGVGSIGDVGSFSFQQSKTMASAEGGVCITSDEAVAERIFRMKHIGYSLAQLRGGAAQAPPQDLTCYPFRATAFQAVILQEQLKDLDARLARYQRAVTYLEDRLARSTAIRFQKPGRRADRQGYYGWVMIFDAPEFEGVSIESIQRAIAAEGLQLLTTWGAVHRFALFNLAPDAYRVHGDCAVTEQIGGRLLWMMHAYLDLGPQALEQIAACIEKVATQAQALLRHPGERKG